MPRAFELNDMEKIRNLALIEGLDSLVERKESFSAIVEQFN